VHHAPGLVAWHRSWWIHPVDIALFALATDAACLVAGAPHTAAAWLIVVRRVWSLLLHANIAWPDTAADHVLVTPSFHDRHHREDLPPANFAASFAIVDRVFRTWARPL
jgi:sterol desaturase/sphingolipid hydroxylase (fatty acid hydroxylase superfamily)